MHLASKPLEFSSKFTTMSKVADWLTQHKRVLIPRDCGSKQNMADEEDGFESSSCHTMIDLESLGTGTPNSLCSTPELDIRGNENCLGNNSKHSCKRDGSLAVNCDSRGILETSASLLHPKKRELEKLESSSSEPNCKE